MSDPAFRSKLAGEARRLAGISRGEIFGAAEPHSRPLNLQADAANTAWVANMRVWNLRRIIEPVLDALGCSVEAAAFLNAVPYRTRKDRMPSAFSRRQAWTSVTAPLLELLQPGVIVALGQKAGDVVGQYYKGTVPTFTVQRSNGDTYLTPQAIASLAKICELLTTGGLRGD
jgi:hypothetical protein